MGCPTLRPLRVQSEIDSERTQKLRSPHPFHGCVGAHAIELLATQNAAADMMPYERLLGDAMQGDSTLFARQDAVDARWRVVKGVLGDTSPWTLTRRALGAGASRAAPRAGRRVARTEGHGLDRRRLNC